jgi:predicted nucleic acid-binding protein
MDHQLLDNHLKVSSSATMLHVPSHLTLSLTSKLDTRTLVIDSSIALRWFFSEPDSDRARSLLLDYQLGELKVIAPDMILSELTNAVWWKQVNHKLTTQDGRSVLDTFRDLHIRLVPTVELIEQAYWLATTTQQNVFDMLYIALARREKCHYITANDQFALTMNRAIPGVTALSRWSSDEAAPQSIMI